MPTKLRTLILSVIIAMPYLASAHSTSGYFVSNGKDCYLVFTNWHIKSEHQYQALNDLDGVYFDLDRDEYYNVGAENIHTFIGPFVGHETSSGEFYKFTDIIDITDLPKKDASALPTWEQEIENWFTNTMGTGFDAKLVWNPVGFFCEDNISYNAVVAKMTTCPTVSSTYIASVARATKTTEPCNPGQIIINLGDKALELIDEVPTLGQWGLIILSLLILVFGAESIKARLSVLVKN